MKATVLSLRGGFIAYYCYFSIALLSFFATVIIELNDVDSLSTEPNHVKLNLVSKATKEKSLLNKIANKYLSNPTTTR